MSNINRAEISSKINKNEPINIQFKFADRDLLMLINSIIAKLLAQANQVFLLNTIITILREVLVNAWKANAKRIYFLKNDINIHDPGSYKKGMALFKEEVIGDFEVIEKDLQNSDYYVNIFFERINDELVISISNNTAILPEELERINLRINKAISYDDFSEAYSDIHDETEGAGLGIVLTIMFLKGIGIDPKSFNISTDGKKTKTSLKIPKELRASKIVSKFKDHILNEIEGIPTFPENVIQLMNLCNQPDSSIEEIADKIMMDPAISTDVIKLSNSAGFITSKRIKSANEAVMTIGLKNVNAILTASNARKILNERYSSYEEIWEHCNKTAFYARTICIENRLAKFADNAFLAGLLHDLGKIILLSTDMALVKKIADEIKNRKIITSTIMEEITVGISHSEIGELISQNWNFPPFLIEAIKYHHLPLGAEKQYRDIVDAVYLANMICGIETRKYYYYYFEESILEKFNIDGEKKFDAFHKKLKEKYENIKSL